MKKLVGPSLELSSADALGHSTNFRKGVNQESLGTAYIVSF